MIVTSVEARERLHQLLDDVFDSHQPIHILHNGKAAVLVSEEDLNDILETIRIESIPGLKESLLKARTEPPEERSKVPGW